VIALARAARYGRWRERPPSTTRTFTDVAPERARAAIAGAPAGWLSPGIVAQVLGAYEIETPRSATAVRVDEAVAAARAIGYPVALKLASATITHKTDVGGVVLDVRDDDGVRRAFAAIRDAVASRGLIEQMTGVSVQPMVARGVETFVGMTRSPGFGALIGFGAGGVAVELWKDVAFRLHPLTELDARDLLDQIRARPLLDGFRGAPPADRDALVDAILRVDRLTADLPQIAELDLNPLIARAPGQGAIAIDARIRLGGESFSPRLALEEKRSPS
jgi:acyl-CoA synthetase (NDP forming)